MSTGDMNRLAEMVHPDATFGGTVMNETAGAEAFVQGFRNLRPITLRNDLAVEDGRIRSSTLLFDWRRWPEVLQELKAR